MIIDSNILLGKYSEHLHDFQQDYPGLRKEHRLHPEIIGDFLALKESARKAGFEIAIVSSFRSYEAQKNIWDQKATGERKVLDENENPVDILSLSEIERVLAIMRWSALPGASRHHWGTDIDIVDYNAIKDTSYQVQLTAQESSDNGPFGPFHQWLDEQIQFGHSHFFYRPYQEDLGGVSPERWHLSHAGAAQTLEDAYDFEFFKKALASADFQLAECVRTHETELFERFVSATTPAPWG